jgi:Fe-S cluster assembly protein SufB
LNLLKPGGHLSEKIIDRPELDDLGTYEFGWSDSDKAGQSARRGINEEVVKDISGLKDEPAWMLERRLKGYEFFLKKPMPS